MDRLSLQELIKVSELADRTADQDAIIRAAIGEDCDSCRVISSIFQSLQALNEHRSRFSITDVTDNAAHGQTSQNGCQSLVSSCLFKRGKDLLKTAR
jgi:hypothetical protein